jgi:predicted nucleic acid-binding protein
LESAGVGVILDSSVLIAAERRGRTVRQILEQMSATHGSEAEIGVSVVSIAELVHGAYRTKTHEQQERRLEFIDRLASDVPTYPVTLEIARSAGRIEGQQEAKGVRLAFEDLLIGVTALHLGYSVATLNVRDFQRVPGLRIVQP